MSLYIYVIDPEVRSMYREHLKKRRVTDSGVDILTPEDQYLKCGDYGVEMKLGIICAAVTEKYESAPYLLLARSSTSLTPLRMSNQIGLADMGYRGELIARVDVLSSCEHCSEFRLEKGRRLFQIVQHNWMPWKNVVLVDSIHELPAAPDNRGDGGFGSTGQSH
jgi:dUTPase